MVNFIE